MTIARKLWDALDCRVGSFIEEHPWWTFLIACVLVNVPYWTRCLRGIG